MTLPGDCNLKAKVEKSMPWCCALNPRNLQTFSVKFLKFSEFAAFTRAESTSQHLNLSRNLFAALQLAHFIGWLPTVDVSYQHLCLLKCFRTSNVVQTSLCTNITLICLIFLLHLPSSMFSMFFSTLHTPASDMFCICLLLVGGWRALSRFLDCIIR